MNRQRARKVDARRLCRFLERVLREHPPRQSAELAVCLISDGRMRELNRAFRGVDRATDVLAFPSDEEASLGDLALCVPAAARQARQARHSLERELRILALHGYLHLLGHDHECDGGRMRRLERRLRRRLRLDGAAGRGRGGA